MSLTSRVVDSKGIPRHLTPTREKEDSLTPERDIVWLSSTRDHWCTLEKSKWELGTPLPYGGPKGRVCVPPSTESRHPCHGDQEVVEGIITGFLLSTPCSGSKVS